MWQRPPLLTSRLEASTVTSRKPLPHRDVFEKLGETQVRFEFAGKETEIGRAADAWIAEMQAERESAAAAKRDAREEETLSIARLARSDARKANIIAIAAIVFATLATIATTIIGVMYAKP
jgi:hypothetical protein